MWLAYANTVEVNLSAPGVNRGVGQQGVSLYTTQEGDSLQSIAQSWLDWMLAYVSPMLSEENAQADPPQPSV